MNVTLIGFMGTGKSSIGRMLAKRLGYKFIDLDKMIEQEDGRKIPVIFEESGEPFFRDLEKKMVKKVCTGDNQVISSGGGAVVDPENKAAFFHAGKVVMLTASPEVILERTGRRGARPVLDREDRGERLRAIKDLLAERREAYRGANFSIDTSTVSPGRVAEEIVRYLSVGGKSHA